jgi:hypothetical protein
MATAIHHPDVQLEGTNQLPTPWRRRSWWLISDQATEARRSTPLAHILMHERDETEGKLQHQSQGIWAVECLEN